jgi:phosphoglycolate phosphatase
MQFRALVFDLDGTLVDSLDDIVTHLLAALADHALPLPTRDAVAGWVGHGADYLVARAVPRPELAAAVLESFRVHYHARPVVTARVYPGLADALDAIAPGRALAVLSNKPHALTVAIADQLLARWRFAPVCGQDATRPRKPDPAGLLAIVAALGCAPADAVMIGDSEVDVATAHAAGMRSIGVAWGLRPVEALAGADHIAHMPTELVSLLR